MLTVAALLEQLDTAQRTQLLNTIQAGLYGATKAAESITDSAHQETVAELRSYLYQSIEALQLAQQLIQERA